MTSPLLVVSDTSPLSNLAMLGWLDGLKCRFEKVWMPQAVAAELGNLRHVEGSRLIQAAMDEGWLEVRAVTNGSAVDLLPAWIHPGEREAIILAEELKADRLLMDDSDGRAVAEQRGISVIGVVGIVLWAKESGRLDNVAHALKRLREECRFFISAKLERDALIAAGELEG